ncbi:hypothetical protein MCERE1_02858 [Burkholderiaceae bacterium]
MSEILPPVALFTMEPEPLMVPLSITFNGFRESVAAPVLVKLCSV